MQAKVGLWEGCVDFPSRFARGRSCSDITDVIRQGGWERYTHPKKAPWWGYIYQFSFIARAVIHAGLHVNWLLLTPAENERAEKAAIDSMENCLADAYLKLAKAQNYQLVVVLHPMLSELESNSFSLQPLAVRLRQIKKL